MFLTLDLSLVAFSLQSIMLFEHNIPFNQFEEINYAYFAVLISHVYIILQFYFICCDSLISPGVHSSTEFRTY